MTTKEREWLTTPEFLRRNKGKIGRNWLYENMDSLAHIKVVAMYLIASDALDQLYEAQASAS